MSQSPSPELVEAYNLIKAGQRQAAGQLLKAYLSKNPRDADGWWLMAHAVGSPENVKTCLERVLQIDPHHEKARARLAELAPPPVEDDDEPDESFFLVKPSAPSSVPPPAPTPKDEDAFDPSASYGGPDTSDPFAPPVPDPFAALDDSIPDPFAPPPAHTTQPPGTGSQPEWGPGLAFTQDTDGPAAATPGARPKPPQPRGKPAAGPDMVTDFAPPKKANSRAFVGVVLVAVAVVVLIGLLIVLANAQGWIHLWGLPPMTELHSPAFSLEYPEEWDAACKTESYGYPVCGIANDPRYNYVDMYVGQDIDIAGMFTDALSFGGLFGYKEPPDVMVSVIAMDVPETSMAYDGSSMAKIMNDSMTQHESWVDSDKMNMTYDEHPITVDGRSGWYYHFLIEGKGGGLEQFFTGGSGDVAYYDVYVPHDGLMFWMSVQAYTFKKSEDIPEDVIQHMIDTIQIG